MSIFLPPPEGATLNDWRSYDEIANVYDRVWATRFEAVARAMLTAMPDCDPEFMLDIGTGTGIVAAVFAEILKRTGISIGCDLSPGMLRQAKARLPQLLVVVADAVALPFKTQTFDIATASFVLSHVLDYRKTLQNVHRVLKDEGIFVVSNWASTVDEYAQAWSALLANVISKREVERALDEVAPYENYFSEEGRLDKALVESGFSIVCSKAEELRFELTIEKYVQDREINSAGRLGRHLLGEKEWMEFRETTINALRARFGDTVHYSRRALIVIGKKPGP
jgi:ubiquinone/menaquinone biosynthesis C-methylase UbiE